MKEFSIEEKAQRYDEAIEKAKSKIKDDKDHVLYEDDVIEIFPELAKSEGERIKKKIITTIHLYYGEPLEDEAKEMIAWLEKRAEQKHQYNSRPKYIGEEELLGEQKPADKVETKFHEGDWVILTAGELSTTLQIVKVDTNKKLYWFNDSSYLPIVDEECLHFWTIQDAKDGDVLVAHECLVLFKEIDGLNIRCYCTYHYLNHQAFYVDTLQNKTAFHPATKEQRDTLMKAMADAGYTFDFEKKELKKVEQKPVPDWMPKFLDELRSKKNYFDWDEHKEIEGEILAIIKWMNPNYFNGKDSEQKVEPKFKVGDIIRHKEQGCTCKITAIDTATAEYGVSECCGTHLPFDFQDAYELVEQNLWSEEDNKHIKSIISTIECSKAQFPNSPAVLGAYNSDLIWLKSLKERYTWKPSEGQMVALNCAITAASDNLVCLNVKDLESLYEDLKKLTE